MGIGLNDTIPNTPESIAKAKMAIAKFEAGNGFAPTASNISSDQPAPLVKNRISMSAAEANAAGTKERLVAEAKASGEASKKEQEDFNATTSASSVGELARTAKDMGVILKELGPNTKVLNVFNEPGMGSAIGKLLTTGIMTPIGSVSMPEFARAKVTATPGVTKRDLELVDELDSVTARIQTAVVQANKGQGSTSNEERLLFAKVAGSTLNSYQMLERVQKVMDAKARFAEQSADLKASMHQPGKPVNWDDFKNSKEYRKLEKDYIGELKDISSTIGKQRPGVEKETQQAPAPKWNHTDAEFEAYKKRKGL
jgi:hypothetical protein